MNRLHDLELCIGYNRIMSIVTDLGNVGNKTSSLSYNLEDKFGNNDDIDNIDQSTSSTTAKSSFHGTAISIIQHPY